MPPPPLPDTHAYTRTAIADQQIVGRDETHDGGGPAVIFARSDALRLTHRLVERQEALHHGLGEARRLRGVAEPRARPREVRRGARKAGAGWERARNSRLARSGGRTSLLENFGDALILFSRCMDLPGQGGRGARGLLNACFANVATGARHTHDIRDAIFPPCPSNTPKKEYPGLPAMSVVHVCASCPPQRRATLVGKGPVRRSTPLPAHLHVHAPPLHRGQTVLEPISLPGVGLLVFDRLVQERAHHVLVKKWGSENEKSEQVPP